MEEEKILSRTKMKYKFIVMYTITEDKLRDTFRDQLLNELSDVEQLNESAYSFSAPSVQEAMAMIKGIYDSIDTSMTGGIEDEDFIDIYCTAHMDNCRQNNEQDYILRKNVIWKNIPI